MVGRISTALLAAGTAIGAVRHGLSGARARQIAHTVLGRMGPRQCAGSTR